MLTSAAAGSVLDLDDDIHKYVREYFRFRRFCFFSSCSSLHNRIRFRRRQERGSLLLAKVRGVCHSSSRKTVLLMQDSLCDLCATKNCSEEAPGAADNWISILPIVAAFFVINVTRVACVLGRRQWKASLYWVLAASVWLRAVVIDFKHH